MHGAVLLTGVEGESEELVEVHGLDFGIVGRPGHCVVHGLLRDAEIVMVCY